MAFTTYFRVAYPKKILIELTPALVVSAVLLGLAFTPLKSVSLIGVIVLWALYWPFSKHIDSFVLRLVLAFVLTNCLQQMLGFVFWLLDVKFSLVAVIITLLIAFLVLVSFRGQHPRMPKLITRADIAALVIAAGSVACLTVFALNGGTLLQQLVRNSTTGFDGVQHIALTAALYDNEGYMYGSFSDLEDELLFFNMPSYPQGWSLTSSIWWHAVTDNVDLKAAPAKVLLMYFSMMMVWYGVLVFLFCRLLLTLVRLLSGKLGVIGITGGVMFTLLVEVMVLLGTPYNSFASFYPALVVPLAISFLLIGLFLDKGAKTAPAVFFVSGLILAGGMSYSWLLAAPAAYVMILAGLLGYMGGVRSFVRWFISVPAIAIIGIALVLLASGQGVVQLLYGVEGLVNYPGGSGVLHNLALTVLLSVALLLVFSSRVDNIKQIFMASTAGIFLLSGAVYIYQFVTTGTSNYFSTKITFIAFMMIALFAGALLTSLIVDYSKKAILSSATAAFFLLSLVTFIPVASDMDLATTPEQGIGSINYLLGKRFLSEYSASQIAALMHDQKIYSSNSVVYKKLNYSEDTSTTQFLQMLAREKIPLCAQTIKGDLIGGWTLNPDTVIECAKGKEFYIIASSVTYQELTEAFRAHPNIKVVLSN